MQIQTDTLPKNSFLKGYTKNNNNVDFFHVTTDGEVSCKDFVTTFYTTWLFKLERLIIAIFVFRPSIDKQLELFLDGRRTSFSAWHVEQSDNEQWLMCDYQFKTRSWFMTRVTTSGSREQTQLFFGTAIVASSKDRTGNPTLTLFFKLLLVFHKWYAVRLLSVATKKLCRNR